jgi:hypothetical protein
MREGYTYSSVAAKMKTSETLWTLEPNDCEEYAPFSIGETTQPSTLMIDCPITGGTATAKDLVSHRLHTTQTPVDGE